MVLQSACDAEENGLCTAKFRKHRRAHTLGVQVVAVTQLLQWLGSLNAS